MPNWSATLTMATLLPRPLAFSFSRTSTRAEAPCDEVPRNQKLLGKTLDHLRRHVGGGGDGEMRIAVFGDDGSDREVGAGPPGRQDEIDLVLRREALDRLHCLLGARLVVIFDNLELHLLAADGNA